jgi:crotonobetainyl-CoA:carnitine CoA-transferase CaiB-like acyl-CoA transferase
LPLTGVRVLDFTAFWAGPSATQLLAALGADVIKVESIQRPDAIRYSVTVAPTTDQWYERGYLFNAANLNKRGITLNLNDPVGRGLVLDLAAQSDVVVENFSPRVMEQFGLTDVDFRAVKPDVITVRMPGWGLAGPWRERPGFATTMEQAAGMAWVTGYEDGPPLAPGLCDPLAGIHAAFAILAALEQKRSTGQGQEIEVSMVDLALSVAAEPILEHAVYGHLMTRTGNHAPDAAPQGVYACTGSESWVALSVSTDEEWNALRAALGHPSWAQDPALAGADGRRAAAAQLDRELEAWCAPRSRDDVLADLRRAGVPAEPVVPAWAIDEDEQMGSRGFWEEVDHPVLGTHRYPGWPIKLSDGPERWYHSPAPLLGQHTEEILTKELGITEDALAVLRDTQVIGDRPLGL